MPYYAGDPGLFSKLKSAIGGAVKGVGAIAGSQLGQMAIGMLPGGTQALGLAAGLGLIRPQVKAIAGGTPGMLAQVTAPDMYRGRRRYARRRRRR